MVLRRDPYVREMKFKAFNITLFVQFKQFFRNIMRDYFIKNSISHKNLVWDLFFLHVHFHDAKEMLCSWKDRNDFHDILNVLLSKKFRVFKEAENPFWSVILYGFLLIGLWKYDKCNHLWDDFLWEFIKDFTVRLFIDQQRSCNLNDWHKEVVLKKVRRFFLQLCDSYIYKVWVSFIKFSKCFVEPISRKELFEQIIILSASILINPAGSEVGG